MTYQLAKDAASFRDYVLAEATATQGGRKWLGYDVEGTSLNTRKSKLVGLSVSFREGCAMYAPLAHRVGENVDRGPCIEVLKQLEEEGWIFIPYNAKYDLNVTQANTGWCPRPGRYEDALELVYLADPDRKVKNLKEVGKKDLGMDMEKFESLFTDAERKAGNLDISTKLPSRCTDYTCKDADAALRIRVKFDHIDQEFNFATTIDNRLINVVRKMEHNGGMEINVEYVEEQLRALSARADALEEQIYRIAGQRFEIGSAKQIGDVLFGKLGIPSPGMTKGKRPQHRTDADTLDKLAKSNPIIELILSFRKVRKAKEDYFEKLKRVHRMGIPVRFNFNMFLAPTFRFAAPGGDPEEDGACGINIQAVSNGEARDMFTVDLSATGSKDDYLDNLSEEELLFVDVKDPQVVAEERLTSSTWDGKLESLPWTCQNEEKEPKLFCWRETCSGCPAGCGAKGIDTTRRFNKNIKMIPSVRQAFKAPNGYTLLEFDYDRQEVVIAANMSGEPRWIRALLEHTDLHEQTAALAYGMPIEQFRLLKQTAKEEYNRKRHIGKTLNFATLYGATAYTLATKANITQGQADQIYDGFVKGHPQLFGWINKVHIFARKNGYTTTYFGRKRWLKQFYASTDRKMHAFADRSSVNTAVQGTAAEVTRIAMVKVESALEKAGLTPKDVRMVLQIHDSLTFLVREELVKQVAPIVQNAMQFKVKSWQVQLSTAPKVGKIWGAQKSYDSVEELLAA